MSAALCRVGWRGRDTAAERGGERERETRRRGKRKRVRPSRSGESRERGEGGEPRGEAGDYGLDENSKRGARLPGGAEGGCARSEGGAASDRPLVSHLGCGFMSEHKASCRPPSGPAAPLRCSFLIRIIAFKPASPDSHDGADCTA